MDSSSVVLVVLAIIVWVVFIAYVIRDEKRLSQTSRARLQQVSDHSSRADH